MFHAPTQKSGVTYSVQFEWRLAAHWAGYRRFKDFQALDGDEQSEIVATYRAWAQMRAVEEYAAAKAMK
ncbi:MAG: hypothetical protein IT323_13565 [Anaerolineae bacterium]|nr:hypothetical protein [Anaerolineae bacterium]